jgi:hypothetical protein
VVARIEAGDLDLVLGELGRRHRPRAGHEQPWVDTPRRATANDRAHRAASDAGAGCAAAPRDDD